MAGAIGHINHILEASAKELAAGLRRVLVLL
jgi:hypothetical protein